MLNYDNKHCWQYDIRLNNLNSDIKKSGLTQKQLENLKCNDFILQWENKKEVFDEVKGFIEKYEWLGKMSLYPTHIFTARYNNILAGVVIMDMPTAFSKYLGENTRELERLISRGACISWSPRNLASKLIMFSINWMVKNTKYRLFTAYSDPEAKELGTIYQACNFYYLGKKSGTKFKYLNERGKWVSDRYFRTRSFYKKLARNNNIEWQKNWSEKDRVFFKNMPKEIEDYLKKLSKKSILNCEKKEMTLKHKYAYILGKNKKETKYLKDLFNKKIKTYPYPKKRGE